MSDELNISWHGEAEKYRDTILKNLMAVIDPELGIDIVSLGFIYSIELNQNDNMLIIMTLTTPGCPLMRVIDNSVKYVINELDFVNNFELRLTFEPAWNISMMTSYAKMALGLPYN